jgi:hypothetical protein
MSLISVDQITNRLNTVVVDTTKIATKDASGFVSAATATAGDTSTKLATTQFVANAIGPGVGASASGAIYENTTMITADYTMGAGKNGHSVGPITIATGKTVTIPSGQTWFVDTAPSSGSASSGSSSSINSVVVATAGQTVVATPAYVLGVGSLQVFVNGLLVRVGFDYTETTTTSITFLSGLSAGNKVALVSWATLPISTTDSGNVVYTPAGTGAVATTVKAGLDSQVLNVFRFMTPTQITDVQANTALIDVSTPCAVAEVCAGVLKSDLYYPPGTYLRDTLRLNSSTNGICIYGAGLGTVIKPKATATYGLQIEGTSGVSNMSGFKVRDMKIDMSLMANTSGVSGIYQRNAYGGMVDNVTVTGWGSTNKSLILKDGAYTTQYSNCTFGAGCKIDIVGVSAPNQVTTITFVNCDGGYITSDWSTAITIFGGAWQTSSAGTFLTLGTVRNFRVYATDIEGFANYFSATGSTHSLVSRDNDFSGMVGNYPYNSGSQYPTFYTFHDGAGNNPVGNVGSGQQIMGITLGGGSATLSNSTLEYNVSDDGWVTFSGLLQIGTVSTAEH